MKNFKYISLLITLIISISLITAHADAQWIKIGGTTSAISLETYDGNLFAGTDYKGLFRSTDNGSTWSFRGLNNLFVNSFAFKDDKLFAGSWGGGVYISTDSGASWTPVTALPNQYVRSLIYFGNYLFAGTDYSGGVYKSSDFGASWVHSGLSTRKVWSFAVMENVLIASASNVGVYRSIDSGTTWSFCGLPGETVWEFAKIGNNLYAGDWGGGIFKSTDIGLNWTHINYGQTSSGVYALDAIGNYLFAGTWGSGVFFSPDAGNSWQSWNHNLGTPVIMSMVISENYIYCGTNDSIWKRSLSDLNILCGPSQHFIDNCSAATDSLDIHHYCETNALLRLSLDTTDNCDVLSELLPMFRGPTIVRRSDPKDSSGRFPGVAQPDGHNDIMETELISMDLRSYVVSNRDTAFLRLVAGAGKGYGPCGTSLKATYGYVHELPNNNSMANSFFDVFFEIIIEDPHGIFGPPNPQYFLYNLTPVGMSTIIDRIPPRCGSDPVTNEPYTVYRPDPNTCTKLYATCIPGATNPPLAKLVDIEYALPVELSSFVSVITGNDVLLKWTTASEKNNAGFGIERSVNNNWENIGSVPGNGNSGAANYYEYTDRDLNSGIYKYRLKQLDFNGNFEYFELPEEITVGIPDKFFLEQNSPNPFNPITTIVYGIPESGNVTLKIYDMTGREVKKLVNEFKEAGYYVSMFDGSSLASGIYFYKLETGNYFSVKKMILLK